MIRSILAGIFLMLLSATAQAQEFNGKVTVRYDRLQGVDAKIFEGLQNSLNQLLNNTKWTNDTYKNIEKIDCSFMLNLTKRTGNIFSGTLTIQASRPVYNATYSTALVNFLDKDVTFKYEQGQVIIYDEQRVSGSDPVAANLTAIFAYYVNIILGLDYDSFQQGGGTDYYKKAQYIVLNAPEEGKTLSGWKSSEGNNKNRYWLVDQILNPRFESFRPYLYAYHRYGLDVMWEKPDEGKKTIMDGLDGLSTINQQNPSSVLLQFFFNAKSAEYINLLKSMPESERKKYAPKLAALDITNASKYNDAR
ncbi:DUF4835 domain-containing protein [Taibaiella sp. KBW10]|uniref:type IX secretion system protein PorD n=1 Tax=Taibaiella sp. KBW10 TaxID=2153357 RepID=UPI000F5A04F6|nr:DUF4835 family protein [Taibaiella sp. KBW10]RQO31523.1 DUF4835 domain-containing protein [Taibaiella sp. KBW10]